MPDSLATIWGAISSELRYMSAHPLEIIAAVTSLICVYLSVKNNIWNWFWGLIGCILYGYIFFKQHLYANAGLQILYFVPMQFVGWYVWYKGNPDKDDAVPVTALKNPARIGWSAATLAISGLLFVGLSPLVKALGFPPPQLSGWDTLTTGMSIVAQYLQTVKKIENWILWILVDIIYTFIIFPKLKLPVTTLLYAVFTFLAIAGARDWYKLMQKGASVEDDGTPPLESQR
ncbi:MAG: nicotinamide riboside transporter PnuC [Cytophagaceae bacterium]|nr:MAG: nicotinamide riboside transporter PnuC [Cytophagaceae bacterium]